MMKIALYRAWEEGAEVWDKVISVATLSPYSHCELVFSDGMFISSSPRDGGVRQKFIIPDENWVLCDLPVSDWSERSIRHWAELLCDKKVGYDWNGVYRFGMPWMKEHPELYFCSEFCLAGLQSQNYFLTAGKPFKASPGSLAAHLKKALPFWGIDTSML